MRTKVVRTTARALQLSFVVLLVVISAKVEAQQERRITLNEAITEAQKNSKDLRLALIDESIAGEQLKQTNSFFLPQISASYSGMATDNPLNAFGLKLQQQRIASSDFDPSLLNHPSNTYGVAALLEVKQPLLNVDLLYRRKAADRQSKLYRYKAQRASEYVTFEVQKAYMQLHFAYQAEKVVRQALSTAQSIYSLTKDRYDQGLLQKSDLLNAQVQVVALEAKASEASSAIQTSSNYLALVVGLEKNTLIKTVGYGLGLNAGQRWELPDDRADFLALSSAIDASRFAYKGSQAGLLPRINAFASYQHSGSTFDRFGSGAYFAGVTLSWNIFSGLQVRHQIKEKRLVAGKLEIQLEQQKDQAAFELNKTIRGVVDARLRIEQYKTAVDHSEESLRITNNRYERGLVSTTDVLQSQSQLAAQQLSLEQAILENNVLQAYLQFLTVSER